MGDRERTILDFVSCSTVGELIIILDDKFGPEQSEDDLRECFRLLAGGSNKLSREAFVAFYTKVLLFIKNGMFLADLFFAGSHLHAGQGVAFGKSHSPVAPKKGRRREW